MPTLYKYLLVFVLLMVIFELGRALYFMMVDKGSDTRSVWALTRRVGLSVLLIGMVGFGIYMGWIGPYAASP